MTAVNDTVAASPKPPPSAKSLAIKGSTWSIVGFGSGQVLRMGSNLLLQLFLSPAAFGIMGWVNIVVNTITMFSNIGLNQSIISNKRGSEPAFLNTAWTILAIRGVCLWLIATFVAWPIGNAVGVSPWYIVAAGVTSLLGGLKSTSYQLHQRELALGTLTILDLFIQIVTIASSVFLAWLTRSVWAIIVGMIISNALYTLLSHVMLKGPRNRFHWDKQAAGEMVSFGKWMFLSTLLMYAASQVDKVLVGSLVPLAMFGIYTQAFSLAQLPMLVSSRLGQFVLYPLLARESRQDAARLGAKVIKARELMSGASLFATLGIVFFAPFFFRLYRPEYEDASWIAQLLAFSVWYTFLQTSCSQALLAVNDSRSLAVSNAVKLPATLILCLLGYGLGALASGGAEGWEILRSLFGSDLWTNPEVRRQTFAAANVFLRSEEHAEARMVGFLLGTAAAGYVTQLVIQLMLRRHGIRIMAQDTVFTLILLALSAVGVLVPLWAAPYLTALATDILAFGLGSVIVASVGIWLLIRIRVLLFQ